MNNITRIVVLQGDCPLRDEFVDKLHREKWVDVCAVTSAGSDLQELIFEYRPQMILINVSQQHSSELMMLRRLRREFSWIGILAFSCKPDYEDVYAKTALDSGADGYISSADTSKELMRAIRMVSRGIQYISPQAKRCRRQMGDAVPDFPTLSRREAEVFCLTGCGYATKRIAEIMNLKVKTIESYRDRIRKKLHLKKGSDLLYTSVTFMRRAARRGIDSPDDLQMVRTLLSATAA